VDKTTGQKFAMAVPSIATLTSGSVTVNLSSRKFAVGESTVGWFDVQENGGGLVIDGVGPVIATNRPTPAQYIFSIQQAERLHQLLATFG